MDEDCHHLFPAGAVIGGAVGIIDEDEVGVVLVEQVEDELVAASWSITRTSPLHPMSGPRPRRAPAALIPMQRVFCFRPNL